MYIYLLRIFVSVCLHNNDLFYLCCIFSPLSLLLYYDISVEYIERSLHSTTTQNQKQHQKVGPIDMSIAYFKISSTSVILFTLFTDNISYHYCNLQLSFINKYYLQKFQQYHKKTAASTSEERYD